MTPYYENDSCTIYQGDALATLEQLETESVNCVVTSPPYWGLRDYGVDGQLGLEATPWEYLEKMTALFAEVRRVLRSDGTMWLNMGDCYVNHKQATGSQKSTATEQSYKVAQNVQRRVGRVNELKHKDMMGMPWRVAFALQDEGWYLRRDIIWEKPTCLPESCTDRPTTSHEYLFLMTKSARYAYDAAAIAVPASSNTHQRHPQGWAAGLGQHSAAGHNKGRKNRNNASFSTATNGKVTKRNKRSVWKISAEPFSEAHFATFPTKLVTPCILAGCPPGGVVLDPFMGSGTTARVAEDLRRRSIGIELNAEYIEMAKRRLAERALPFDEPEATSAVLLEQDLPMGGEA